jgi:hypothetical protein
MTCTTHVCTTVSGKTERIASGSPVNPSQQAIRTSLTPRFRRSVTTFCQNFAPSLSQIPPPQGVLAALKVHADGQVGDLGADHPVVLDLHPDPVHREDGVDLVEGTATPQLDLVGDHVGHVRDQFPGRGHAVHLPQMGLDIASGHPPRVQRQNHVLNAANPAGAFRHDPRLERTVPVTGNIDLNRTVHRRHGLDGLPIAGITTSLTGRITGFIPQMIGHLGLKRPLQHRLRHLIQQPVHPIQGCSRHLRFFQQRVDLPRRENLREPLRRLTAGIQR